MFSNVQSISISTTDLTQVRYYPGAIPAGFPSPAEDFVVEQLDLEAELTKHPRATYYVRLVGDSLAELGVVEGTLAVVDRLERPKSGHVVIARIDADFTCKVLHLRNGQMRLKAANPNYPDIVPKEGQTVEILGVVTAFIRKLPV
jgi:DNA polymerase V